MTQKDVMQLLIGKDVGGATPTSTAGSDPIYYATNTYLLDGEIVATNSHNQVINATTVLTDDLVAQHGVKFIQRSGDKLIHSDLIMQDSIRRVVGKIDVAFAEQLSYIGFNGVSTGEIFEQNSTLYVIRLNMMETDLTGFGQEKILNIPFKSDASATEIEIANGLVLAGDKVLRRQVVQPIRIDLVNKNAVDNADAFDNNATVVLGSDTFSVLSNVQAGGVAAVVGDYVRFSETPTVTGTALTDGIYKITAINTLDITVDRKIQTPSGSYTASKAVAEVLLASEVTGASCGIKLQGIARSFSLPKRRYSKVVWTTGLDDGFGATIITNTTKMTLGSGFYPAIAQLEYDLLGNEGDEYKADFLWTAYKSDADTSGYYDTVTIDYFGGETTQGIGASPQRNKQLTLAFKTGFSNDEGPDIVIDVIEAYSTITTSIAV